MNFGLTRATVLAAHFRANSLFFYPAESAQWLDAASSLIAFLNRLHAAHLAAMQDAATVYDMIRARSDRMEALVVDDMTTIARLKAGAVSDLDYAQVYATEMAYWEVQEAEAQTRGETVARPQMAPPTPGRLQSTGRPAATDSEALKAFFDDYFQKRKVIQEAEAKGAIKDASIMCLPYKGLVRRAAKLAHNVEAVDAMIDARIYVNSTRVAEYIQDAVFKGVWSASSQATFARIIKTFAADRAWSSRAAAKVQEWAAIVANARTISDARGFVYSAVVERSLEMTGVAV